MKKRILRNGILLVALLSISLGACKSDEKTSEPETTKVDPAAVKAPEPAPEPSPTPEPAKVAPAETEDYFYVEGSHAPQKPGDPVKVSFPVVKVVKSAIDVTKMAEATAEIEISMGSLDSGVPKRDGHLGSKDYFDSAKFATATIKVTDVKQKDENSYTAKSEVTAHGVSATWDVEFKIVEKTDAAITVEAEHKFSRLDFGVGKAEGDPVATDVTAKLRVTLPTT